MSRALEAKKTLADSKVVDSEVAGSEAADSEGADSEVATFLKAQQDEGEEDDRNARDKREQNEPGSFTLSHCFLHQPLYLHLLQHSSHMSAGLLTLKVPLTSLFGGVQSNHSEV